MDINNVTVDRNGIKKTLTPTVFGKRSPNAGKQFPVPCIATPELKTATVDGQEQQVLVNVADFIWVGVEDIATMATKFLRQVFADIFVDNIDEKTGEFNEEQYQLDIQDFTAGVQKLSDIEEALDNLQAEQQSYALDEHFGEIDANGEKTTNALELEKKIKETAAKIKPLRIQKSTIEGKYADRAAKRKAKKEAAEAAVGTAKAPAEAAA